MAQTGYYGITYHDAIENLLDEKAEQMAWQERERIGFKKN